ncbi:DNA polymerase III subunit epsilon [Pontixanthobacter aestiaquae]|uniref:DNA polymerase III subunit epsilon n=1 Tax=Pontixanthobacter aestiaquae TaxID=1509367 RepID=A0A844Z3Q2_9SPHN|nr:DNA polymerase III subunit epsilon [Pontixanthobacter aestiaquae]MDN3646884.1 DNA polymerase III subunit epsilon [Pontixanthobacter aestiaquae]MXO82134.1 DNA polymerase III subunit epsilon [Pontixanthobacter aestiaquae]
MREIVFDTETTGLDPKSGDRMVEMGCVEMVNRVATGNTYHAYYNPERDMPAGAEAVHGLSSAFLSDKPLFRDIAQELLDFMGDSPLVAHNAGFDFGFLNNELALIDREPINLDRMVDTVAIARKKHPGAKNSLDALCSRYGVDRSHRVKHGALLDAELLAQVYVELLGGRQIGLELAAESKAVTVTGAAAARTASREFRAPRAHTPSAKELARHQAFIKTIEAPLWNK